MNRYVYDASMLIGVCLVGAGIGLQLGIGWGLAAAGATVIGLTAFGALMAGPR